MEQPAVISGLGVVSAFGRGAARLWTAMAEGHEGIQPIARFDAASLGVELAGMVADRNTPDSADVPAWRLCVEYAIDAAREAWARAGLAGAGVPPERIALVMGTSLGDPGMPLHRMTEQVGDALGAGGPRLTISTACTSSANALGLALDLLRMGAADVVVAGGSDVLTPLTVAGFHALGVLSTARCAPFSEPPGTSLGEGAGFLILERTESARRRGASTPLAVLGYGLSADAFHDTGPDPTGAGVARAMRTALEHAGLSPDQVEYVNAHGTGTLANDPAEWRAIQQVFGQRARSLPVSSSKSFLGHAQGAAGIVEAIATLVALERGMIPPTRHFTVPRPNSPADPVGQDTPRRASCRVALCTSSAFGGANCAVVVGRAEGAMTHVTGPDVGPDIKSDAGTNIKTMNATAGTRRPVFVEGLSALGPLAAPPEELLEALLLRGGPRRAGGRVPAFRLEDVLPSADPRGIDPCSRYLTASAALALRDAGCRVRGAARDRTGLIVGVNQVSAESKAALDRTLEQHGYRGMSASLFSRMVLNAPVGTCSKLLGLRGPLSTITAGSAAGMVAIVYAAELLAARTDADRIVAGGVDELSEEDERAGLSEGAACAVLSGVPGAPAGPGALARPRVLVAGWGMAGPGGLAAATRDALAAARIDADAVDVVIGPVPPGVQPAHRVDPDALAGHGDAFTSALAFVAGVVLARTGRARRILVTQAGGASADCAIVLATAEEARDHAS
jgi:3-oxoacyl-[acyl-carrier-protein] synthase II